MALGLYELINNINKQIKSICCKVNALLDSGAGSYRVYTALLTQSGGDDPQELVGSGLLTIGVTYRISDNASNPDFTNVGAPNNDYGTMFVATGTTPTSWGEATLEYNTGAPVVTVLENTIGNIWFTYNGVGDYSVNSDGLFTIGKCFSIISFSDTGGYGIFDKINLAVGANFSNSIISITNAQDGALQEGILSNTPIEIRVYS